MKATIGVKDLRRIIAATKGFIASTGTRDPVYQHIKLDFNKEFCSVTAVALDGHRLSVETATCMHIEEDFSVFIKSEIPKASSREEIAIIESKEETCYIRIGGTITGYKQPKGIDKFVDYNKTLSDILDKEVLFRIGFNGDYLSSALRAACASCGGSFKMPVILEFRGDTAPIVLNTNEKDVKVVLPVRVTKPRKEKPPADGNQTDGKHNKPRINVADF